MAMIAVAAGDEASGAAPVNFLGAIVDTADPINQIIASSEDGKLGLVQAADRIDACLERMQLSKRIPLSPAMVGVDPENRGSEGVNAIEVGLLASDIVEAGWSWAACAHATCIEQAPGKTDIEDFNLRLAQDAALAPVEKGQIRFGSLACSHTNMALRAIAAGVPSTDEYMSEDGRFSLTRLAARDAEFAKAVQSGLFWTVYSWKVRVYYPKVCGLIESARNVGAAIARKESEMQTLLRLQKLSVQMRGADGEVPWVAIRKSILRTKTPCANKLGSMICFIIARSGGEGVDQLRYLASFFRNFVDASVREGLAASMYDALAQFPHHFLGLAFSRLPGCARSNLSRTASARSLVRRT